MADRPDSKRIHMLAERGPNDQPDGAGAWRVVSIAAPQRFTLLASPGGSADVSTADLDTVRKLIHRFGATRLQELIRTLGGVG
jgi:hypothetical protein